MSSSDDLLGRLCSHCAGTMRGSASLNGDYLCHPDDGMDCYHLVTVYKHGMPCMECWALRCVEDLIREYPDKAAEELRKLGYDVRPPT